MTPFYDRATIRRLAKTSEFYAGAAWILDQQDEARPEDYDDDWVSVPRNTP